MVKVRDLEKLLESAMAAHQSGNYSEAAALYQEILLADPNHNEALHFFGLLKHESGESEQGLTLIERAISLAPQSPHYLGNRAAILGQIGRLLEASKAYRKAITAAPENIDLYLGMAKVLEEMNDDASAIATLETARRLDPKHDQLCIDLARLLSQTERASEAVSILNEMIRRHPLLIELKLQQGQLLLDLYRMDEAEEIYRSAVALDHSHPLPNYKLARCLAEKGQWAEAIPSYEEAIRLKPDYAEAFLYLARAYQELGDLDRAIKTCEKAYRLRPAYRGDDILLGILLQEAERFEEAVYEFEVAVDKHSDNIAVAALAQCQLAAGNGEAARKTAETYLQNNPGDTHVLVTLSLVLEGLGERKKVRNLVDFDSFLRPTIIKTPNEFENLNDFNQALSDHLLAHPSLILSPPRNATRDGYHSGELFEEPMGPFSVFQHVLEKEIESYIASLPNDPSHPFIAGKPDNWWLNAWGIVLDGPGHQISHAHNTAWLSGVYYVQLPDVVNSGNKKQPGWIEFGPPPPDFPVPLDPETIMIEPEVGKLILFPGYMFHRTIPTGVIDRRISIAFNVIAEPL